MSWVSMTSDKTMDRPVAGLRLVLILLALVWLAGCATTAGQSPDAEARARQAEVEQALAGEFADAVEQLRNGNLDNARRRFEALHQAAPERTGPLANLAIIALRQGDRAQAQSRFLAVLERAPGHVQALNHLGVLAREEGAFEEAEARYRRALEHDPEYLSAMLNLAILLDIYLGRVAEALPLYERYQSLQDDPDPRLKDWIFDARNRL